MKTMKLCKDCKHNIPDSDFKSEGKAQEYAKCGQKLNPGSGVSEFYCSVERRNPAYFLFIPTGQCGKLGRFWEPKE